MSQHKFDDDVKKGNPRRHRRHWQNQDEESSSLPTSQGKVEKYGTAFERDHLDGLEVQRADKGRVSRTGKVIDRFHVTHPDFPGQEFLVARRLFSVLVAPTNPFEQACPSAPPAANNSAHQQAARESAIDSVGLTAPVGRRLTRDEIEELRAAGHTVAMTKNPTKRTGRSLLHQQEVNG